MKTVTYQDIEKAKTLLEGHIVNTPTLYSPYFSKKFRAQIYLKLENMQITGSFKERGAYIKLKSLSQDALSKGVIAMSAGNHAQAVAYNASLLKTATTIVMPRSTPPTKIANTERWGATVVLAGETLEEANQFAQNLARKDDLTFIHPFDDPAIIAGQGTISIEMLDAVPSLDALIIPIGGGGLSAGIAISAKKIKPSLEIYGVQVEGHNAMSHLLFGIPIKEKHESTLAEGIAVKTPGQLPQEILKPRLEDILVVTEREIELAVDLFVRNQNLVVEGAGAAGLAGLIHSPDRFSKKNVGLVVSGGNIDSRLLSAIMLRGQIREGRINLLEIKIHDVPGVLAKISDIISHHQGNILEVKHQRLFYEIPIKMANLHITVETENAARGDEVVNELLEAGFSVKRVESDFQLQGVSG